MPLPFSAPVMQSQQSGHGANSKLAWKRAVLYFGCHDRLSHLRCMREVPAAQLRQVIETHYVDFGPAQEDGTSTMDVRKSIDAGTFAKVPVLIGTNANEARAFEAFVGMEKSSQLLDFVGKWFHIDTSHLIPHMNELLKKLGLQNYHGADRYSYSLT
jgi:carboxylesterase type B